MMKLSTVLFFLLPLLCSLQVRAQYVIPGAQQQPAWVFPMYFEDGFGYRDTVYLGYDPNASTGNLPFEWNSLWNPDTVFGEVFEPVVQDSIFYVSLRNGYDYPYRINVSISEYARSYEISCNHAKLPLTIKWDKSLLYSTELPFPSQLPLPTVEGIFWVGYLASLNYDCGGTEPVVISDTTAYYDPECTFADSVVLDLWNCPGCITNALLTLDFESWDGGWTSIEEETEASFRVFPNPFNNRIDINLYGTDNQHVAITDITGRTVFSNDQTMRDGNLSLDTESWPAGIYIISVVSDGKRSNLKMLKTN